MKAIKGLINREDNQNFFSRSFISQKASKYIERLVKSSSEQSKLESEGWLLLKKNPKSVRMGKEKRHDKAFNDRVWALFAKMGIDYINDPDINFYVNYDDEERRQIDVFAADNEAIIIIECKSSAKRKMSDHKTKTEINEFIYQIDGLRTTAQSLFDGKQKVAFIWATNNLILGSADKERLSKKHIFHFNQDDFNYFGQLCDHLGSAAKYQFYGKLFEGQKIPELKNRVPAIKGQMAGNLTFYSFNIDAEYLLKIGYILHRSDTSSETASVYQRIVKRNRLNKIRKFINGGGYFPNSIIISIDTKKRESLKWEKAKIPENDTSYLAGVLHLPQLYRSAFIIDGQHRLYGFTNTSERFNAVLPVIAFLNLDIEEQERLFVEINHEQKSVPANLLSSLMADLHFGSSDLRKAIPALRSRMLIDLNNDEESPFYKRIKITEEETTLTLCLTLKTISSWALGAKVKFFGTIKGNNLVESGYLLRFRNSHIDHYASLEVAKEFFLCAFNYLASQLSEQWDYGNDKNNGFIATNIGVSASILTINDIIDYLIKSKSFQPRRLSGKQIADVIEPYLESIANYIKNLSVEEKRKFKSFFGTGAPLKVQRWFQRAIYEEHEDFLPEGLEKWIREVKGEYTDKAWDIGFKHLEPMVHEFIIRKLKERRGIENWWHEGVPENVRKDCARLKEEKRSKDPPEKFFFTIHYYVIAKESKNWEILGNPLTPPNLGNEKKEKRLEWLKTLNSIRSKYSHPQLDPVTKEEYEFLLSTYSWLEERTKK